MHEPGAVPIRRWLSDTNANLAKYAEAFEDYGYEDVGVLEEATEEDIDEVMEEVQMKMGRRRLLVNAMAALRARGGGGPQ